MAAARKGPGQTKATARASRSLYARIIGAILSVALFVLIAELVLSAAGLDLHYQDPSFAIHPDMSFPHVFKRDSKLLWCFRPGTTIKSQLHPGLEYRINPSGRRGPETLKSKQGYRIVTLGNSCTFGWGVRYEDSWGYRLERILNRELPDTSFEVINAGIPGYSSHQGKTYFAEELLGLAPDMVLIMFAWNDHSRSGRRPRDGPVNARNCRPPGSDLYTPGQGT